jgi:hypothetical protein
MLTGKHPPSFPTQTRAQPRPRRARNNTQGNTHTRSTSPRPVASALSRLVTRVVDTRGNAVQFSAVSRHTRKTFQNGDGEPGSFGARQQRVPYSGKRWRAAPRHPPLPPRGAASDGDSRRRLQEAYASTGASPPSRDSRQRHRPRFNLGRRARAADPRAHSPLRRRTAHPGNR